MGRAEDAKNATSLLRAAICGQGLQEIIHEAPAINWIFHIGPATVSTDLWRLLSKERVSITSEDHLQLFGLSAPVDAGAEVMKATNGTTISEVEVSKQGDLIIGFSSGSQLEMMVSSSGYENWEVSASNGLKVIGLGGGDLAIWSK